MGQSRPLFLSFWDSNWQINTFDLFHCQCQDSNLGSLVSEVTALPTAPQTRPNSSHHLCDWSQESWFMVANLKWYQRQSSPSKLPVKASSLTSVDLIVFLICQVCTGGVQASKTRLSSTVLTKKCSNAILTSTRFWWDAPNFFLGTKFERQREIY